MTHLHHNRDTTHALEIYANIEINDSELELQFDSIDDAVHEWMAVYNISCTKEDALRDYAEKTLDKKPLA